MPPIPAAGGNVRLCTDTGPARCAKVGIPFVNYAEAKQM
jgi:hypothetical protein